jgi:hypothetical protein
MSKTLIEAPITTRRARSGLAIGVHWRGLDPDIHLGYRKGKRGGRWLVRWYGGAQQYQQETIGTADDLIGEGNLSFEEASRLARQKVAEARLAAEKALLGPTITVGSAIDAYVAMRDARETARAGRPVKSDAHRLKRYVDRELADREFGALTELDLKAWQERLAGLKRSSLRRLCNDVKAALNACYLDHRRNLPADLPVTIKYGLRVEAAEWDEAETGARDNQILPDDRVREIITEAAATDNDGDFALLVLVLAATGARFSQVKRMRVRDAQPSQSRLFVPSSRKGKGRTPSFITVRIGPDVVAGGAPAGALAVQAGCASEMGPVVSRAVAERVGNDPQVEPGHGRTRTVGDRPLRAPPQLDRAWNSFRPSDPSGRCGP